MGVLLSIIPLFEAYLLSGAYVSTTEKSTSIFVSNFKALERMQEYKKTQKDEENAEERRSYQGMQQRLKEVRQAAMSDQAGTNLDQGSESSEVTVSVKDQMWDRIIYSYKHCHWVVMFTSHTSLG